MLTGTGSYCWLGLRANHIRLENGTERFFAVYFDVDSYVSKQLSLEKINNTMTSILDNIPAVLRFLCIRTTGSELTMPTMLSMRFIAEARSIGTIKF